MSRSPAASTSSTRLVAAARFVAPGLLVLVSGIAVTVLGPLAWVTLLDHGRLVMTLLAAAGGWGAWPAAWLAGTRPRMQAIPLAIALGLGILGTLTLLLGLVGGLRIGAWLLIAGGGALLLLRWWRARGTPGPDRPGAEVHEYPVDRSAAGAGGSKVVGQVAGGLLLAVLAVPLGVAAFGATLPPGLLWNEEAGGYDVLEYHLQVPREWFEAGQIEFLPHNVYASFPQQVEMLYLLLMYLAGSPLAAACAAQLLHLSCGVLAVLLLAGTAPPGMPRAAVALAAGAVPWLAYLGAMAYVELGVVLFAAAAGVLALEAVVATVPSAHRRPPGVEAHPDSERQRRAPWRLLLAAGLLAGFAGGCKYTALVFVPTALGIAWMAVAAVPLKRRLTGGAIFAAGALVAFSPWLARNAAFTGNPVYPFAYGWFGGRDWSPEQDRQWSAGHRLSAAQGSAAERLRIAADELWRHGKFGPGIWLIGGAGLLLARNRWAVMAGLWLALILAGWLGLTHMPGRFAVVVVVPLALLLAQGLAVPIARPRARGIRTVVAALATGAAGIAGVGQVLRIYGEHESWFARQGVGLHELPGQVSIMAGANPLNSIPPERRLWLVGEARVFYVRPRAHYTVAFSRDPWLEFAAGAAPRAAVAWLRSRGVTHVVFSWPEIERLRATYGFAPGVTRAWVAELRAAGARAASLPTELATADVEVLEVLPEMTSGSE